MPLCVEQETYFINGSNQYSLQLKSMYVHTYVYICGLKLNQSCYYILYISVPQL